MKKKYKVLMVVIIILAIILIAGGVFAYLYFGTDTFKSNKELFVKYIAQNDNIIKKFESKELNTYAERQRNNPYSIEGNIKTNAALAGISNQKTITDLQNCSITFIGNIDKTNNYIYQNINANYADNQSLNFEYVQKNDIYAIKINEILNKFVGIQNSNLKELARRMGVNEETISMMPDSISLAQIPMQINMFTDEELEQLKSKYLKIITDSIKDEMFSKESANNYNIYTLTFTQEHAKEIAKNILNTVANDELIINKVKSTLEKFGMDQENINYYIEDAKTELQKFIKSKVDTDATIAKKTDIRVYEKNKELSKTEIVLAEQDKLILTPTDTGFNLEINENGETTTNLKVQAVFSASDAKINIYGNQKDNGNFELRIEETGINTNEVHEVSELSLTSKNGIVEESDDKVVCTYTAIKKFGVPVQTNTISNEDIMLINTAPNVEAVVNLFGQIYNSLQALNTTKMQAAGVGTDGMNPFLFYIPAIIPTVVINAINI